MDDCIRIQNTSTKYYFSIMSILIRNIKGLAQTRATPARMVKGVDMQTLPMISDAYLLIENGLVKSFGPMSEAPDRAGEVIDATGRFVLPAWCDPHTHIVYAGSREG